jgi:hypothetical protein
VIKAAIHNKTAAHINPNYFAYCLNQLADTPEKIEKFMHLWGQIRKEGGRAHAHVSNSFIGLLAAAGEFTKVRQEMEKMENNELPATVATYGAIIDGAVRGVYFSPLSPSLFLKNTQIRKFRGCTHVYVLTCATAQGCRRVKESGYE